MLWFLVLICLDFLEGGASANFNFKIDVIFFEHHLKQITNRPCCSRYHTQVSCGNLHPLLLKP